jgi:allene oxide cyclase-like protein
MSILPKELSMRGSVISAISAAVVAPGGVALAASPQSGAANRQFSVYTATAQTKLIDLGDTGFSLGDQVIFSDNVFKKKGGTKIGFDGGVCSVVRVSDAKSFSGKLQCQVTYSLPGGEITVQELYSEAHAQLTGSHTAAITGGTGRFRSARGEAKVTFLGNLTASVKFSMIR